MARHQPTDKSKFFFRGSGGSVGIFWSNGLVGAITTLAITLLFWPVIDKVFTGIGQVLRPARA